MDTNTGNSVRVYLHAGTHKTGTTAIQRFSSQHRLDLKQCGILYPSLHRLGPRRTEAHHLLAHVVAGEAKAYSSAAAQAMVHHWIRNAARNQLTILVSAEAIWRHTLPVADPGPESNKWIEKRREYLRALAAYFEGPVELVPVVVLRRPDDFAESVYKERIMKGLEHANRPFKEFVRSVTTKYLRYFDNLALMEETLGFPRVMIYEDLKESGDLVRAFFEQLGVPVSGNDSGERVRVSLTPSEATAKLYLDSLGHGRANAEALDFLKSGDAALHIANMDQVPRSFWPSPDARMKFLRHFRREADAIRQRWLPERATLFPPPTDEELRVEPVRAISNELKAAIETWAGR